MISPLPGTGDRRARLSVFGLGEVVASGAITAIEDPVCAVHRSTVVPGTCDHLLVPPPRRQKERT